MKKTGAADESEVQACGIPFMSSGSSSGRFLVINNISKMQNIRNLCLIAGACDFSVLFVQPSDNVLEESVMNPSLMSKNLQIRYHVFSTLDEMKGFLAERKIPLVGIEIMETAISMKSYDYEQRYQIAFMPGNEGMGLTPKQKKICDHFLYIPQYGAGTASLNVNLATSIVLYDYCSRTSLA